MLFGDVVVLAAISMHCVERGILTYPSIAIIQVQNEPLPRELKLDLVSAKQNASLELQVK